MRDVACIVVTFKNEETIAACLKSVSDDLSGYSAEIVLVDNDSGDGTVAAARSAVNSGVPLRIIENHFNAGFARGVNQGIAASDSAYILILNPDAVIQNGFFSTMISYLEKNPGTGIVSPRHMSPQGETIPSCREFPTHISLLFNMTGLAALFPGSRVFNSWKMGYFDHETSREVDQPMGACMLTRMEDVDSVGYMDEQFWMFFNDVDWCRRYKQCGKKVMYLADAVIMHNAGHSVRKNRAKMIISSHRAFARYFRKYYTGCRWILPNLLTGCALLVSAGVRVFIHAVRMTVRTN